MKGHNKVPADEGMPDTKGRSASGGEGPSATRAVAIAEPVAAGTKAD